MAQPPAERIVDVPDINGMAVTLVKPAFPETAVDVGADGESVVVKVVVNEHGNVVSTDHRLELFGNLRNKTVSNLLAKSAKIEIQIKGA